MVVGAGKPRDPINNVLLPRQPCHSSDGAPLLPEPVRLVELGLSAPRSSCAIGESHDLMHSCYYEHLIQVRSMGIRSHGQVANNYGYSSRRDWTECGLGSLILDEILESAILQTGSSDDGPSVTTLSS